MGLPPPRGLGALCTGHCNTCAAQGIRAVRTRRRPLLPPGCPAVPRECSAGGALRTRSDARIAFESRAALLRWWQHGVRVSPVTGSEPHTSRHGLTTATQHLCRCPAGVHRRATGVSPATTTCQALVRFSGPLPIEPRVPPLVQALANSLDFQPCGRTPQAGYFSRELRPGAVSTTAATRPARWQPAAGTSRGRGGLTPGLVSSLRPGLTGFLIPLAPLAFAPEASGAA